MSKINGLSDVYGYNDLFSYYEKNKDRPWQEWLSFDTVFDKPGKQGLVGLFSQSDDKKKQYVFKLSQYINYLIQHEECVMKGLNDLSPYCPHFCKSFGTILCSTDPNKAPFYQISNKLLNEWTQEN